MKNTIGFSEMEEKYFNYCIGRKNLDKKTIKSYRIDFRQYIDFINSSSLIWYEKGSIESYIDIIHFKYKPKTYPLNEPPS